MKAPAFWANPPECPGWQAQLLAPAAAAWRLGAELRAAGTSPQRASVPVVCVGNLTAGGAGKTPMVAWLVGQLQAAGETPHVLSRGHGGRIAGPHRVDPERDLHADVGDEPLLLATLAPAWISRDRVAGAIQAADAGASVVVMDDGLQNPALVKDVSIVMVDAGQGFGNQRLIPAGPLREPVATGLARADAIVLVGSAEARQRARHRWPVLAGAEVHEARLEPRQTGLSLKGQPVLAFAGIGRPAKFFDTLKAMGAELVGAHPFPDHHVYSDSVLTRLAREARAANAMLVTTEKDAVRLPAAFRREVMTVPVALQPEDPRALIDAILGRLRR